MIAALLDVLVYDRRAEAESLPEPRPTGPIPSPFRLPHPLTDRLYPLLRLIGDLLTTHRLTQRSAARHGIALLLLALCILLAFLGSAWWARSQ